MTTHYLSRLFTPDTIALYGASDRVDSVGGVVFRNLLGCGFKGKIFAINIKHDKVQGQKAYASLKSIESKIDLAVVATPAVTIPEIVRECGEQGVKMMLILSAGFREIGAQGKRLEDQVVQLAKSFGIRIMGPNCLGIIRPPRQMNITFGNNNARSGDIALVSQSGAMCTAILDWAEMNDVGFSAVVSTGIAADLDFGDYLDFLVSDPSTRSILLYIEGIHDARRFMSSLRAAARIKPVIALKVGRHAAGADASMSHTGALVGDDDTFSSALSRCGVLRVQSVSQLFAAAKALSSPRYRNPVENIVIITNGGGPGVMAADHAEDLNIKLATISKQTIDKLNEVLPAVWSHGNPVDVIGDAPPARYQQTLDICLQDPDIDGAIVILTPQAMTQPTQVAEAVIASAANSRKPVLTSWMGGGQVEEARQLFSNARIPTFRTLENAVEAFSFMASYNRNQKLLMQTPGKLRNGLQRADKEGARLIIENVLSDRRNVLNELESIAVLKAFNIPVVQAGIAHSANEALIIAESIGFPIAMKILASDISHKSDAGGVRLNIDSAAEVRRSYHDLIEQVRAHQPEADIRGVTIEKMHRSSTARELMIGIKHDPVFGPVISFGSGGTMVEIMGDVAIALPPLNRQLAIDLIEHTRAHRLLGNFRHLPAANLEMLIDVLLRISNIACELPWIQEMDINPLMIDENTIVAVDARIRVDYPQLSNDPYHHLAIHPYPAHLVSRIQLRDGEDITIRPIRPEDAEIEKQFINGLSDEARYFRFMNVLHEVTQEMLIRFTQIDYHHEMALIAVRHADGMEQEIGVARYATNPDKISCEFALVVSDVWQHKGIGHHLMTRLIQIARDRGLEVFQGEILANNVKMLEMIGSLGFKLSDDPEDKTIKRAKLSLHN